jgi:Zn-dependent protease
MLRLLFTSGYTVPEMIIYGAIMIIVLVFSLSIHEFMHGYAAYRLGDDTARLQGRLTLNPLAHLDPIGALMMLLAGFGWAKPVPIDPSYYKNHKRGTMLTSIAGPLSNLLLAFLAAFPLIFLASKYNIDALDQFDKKMIMFNFSWMFFAANVNLAVFNLIPMPPLDGSKILTGILPTRTYFNLMRYENYVGLVFLAVVFLFPSQFSYVLRLVSNPVRSVIIDIASPIVSLFV